MEVSNLKKTINMNLSELAEGSLQERFDHEMKKVTQNIMDPNTEPDKKRKITITLTVTGDEHRDQIDILAEVKSTLVPRKNVTTRALIDDDGKNLYANELKSGQRGQTFFDPEDSELKDDTGRPIQEIEKEQSKSTNEQESKKVYRFTDKATKAE